MADIPKDVRLLAQMAVQDVRATAEQRTAEQAKTVSEREARTKQNTVELEAIMEKYPSKQGGRHVATILLAKQNEDPRAINDLSPKTRDKLQTYIKEYRNEQFDGVVNRSLNTVDYVIGQTLMPVADRVDDLLHGKPNETKALVRSFRGKPDPADVETGAAIKLLEAAKATEGRDTSRPQNMRGKGNTIG